MVRIGPFSPPQIAEEIWKYPTSLLPRRWADLNQQKALFLKKAESLGTDNGAGTYSVTHGQRANDEPLFTELKTGNLIGNWACSFGIHNISRLDRIPAGVAVSRVCAYAHARILQTTDEIFNVGFTDSQTGNPAWHCAHIHYEDTEGANFKARSYVTAEELTDTGVAADAAWHRFQVDLELTSVKFYIDGSLVATHTSQIPAQGLPDGARALMILIMTGANLEKYAHYSHAAVWFE